MTIEKGRTEPPRLMLGALGGLAACAVPQAVVGPGQLAVLMPGIDPTPGLRREWVLDGLPRRPDPTPGTDCPDASPKPLGLAGALAGQDTPRSAPRRLLATPYLWAGISILRGRLSPPRPAVDFTAGRAAAVGAQPGSHRRPCRPMIACWPCVEAFGARTRRYPYDPQVFINPAQRGSTACGGRTIDLGDLTAALAETTRVRIMFLTSPPGHPPRQLFASSLSSVDPCPPADMMPTPSRERCHAFG
jgi:hypothetical protein